jgi:hypothetical protein
MLIQFKSAVLYPRWPPLLKIEISSNGQNCSILSQKVPKFELSSSLCLYSSNLGTFWLKIEQFWPFEDISIFSNSGHLGYRGFFMNFEIADFDRLCKLEKKGG